MELDQSSEKKGIIYMISRIEQQVACLAHNQKVDGSNPSPAIKA